MIRKIFFFWLTVFTKLINWYINNLYIYIYYTYISSIYSQYSQYFFHEWSFFLLLKDFSWKGKFLTILKFFWFFLNYLKIIANIFKLKTKKYIKKQKNYLKFVKAASKFFNNHIKTYIFMLLWLCFWVLVFFFSSHFPCFYFLLIWQFFFFYFLLTIFIFSN